MIGEHMGYLLGFLVDPYCLYLYPSVLYSSLFVFVMAYVPNVAFSFFIEPSLKANLKHMFPITE